MKEGEIGQEELKIHVSRACYNMYSLCEKFGLLAFESFMMCQMNE